MTDVVDAGVILFAGTWVLDDGPRPGTVFLVVGFVGLLGPVDFFVSFGAVVVGAFGFSADFFSFSISSSTSSILTPEMRSFKCKKLREEQWNNKNTLSSKVTFSTYPDY